MVLSSVEELPSPATRNTFSLPPYGFIFEGEAKLIFPGKRGMPAGVHACVCALHTKGHHHWGKSQTPSFTPEYPYNCLVLSKFDGCEPF